MPDVLRYGPGRAHRGDLHLPTGAPPHPVVVVVHGGFWRASFRRRLMTAVSADLARRGIAAWNIEFRRLGLLSRGGWPQTFEDVAAATDHLAAIAGEHGLDLARVGTLGHSAGGHLALWLAARGGLPEGAPGAGPLVPIAAAVAQAGVVDLERAHVQGMGGGVVRRLLGGSPAQVPDRYALASPAARLPLGVPQLLVHGERDGIVPATMSRTYVDAARAGGDDVELVLLADAEHFEHLDPGEEAWQHAAEWLQRRLL